MVLWGNPYKFVPYSHQHVFVLGAVVSICATIAIIGRRQERSVRERVEPLAGVLLLAIWCIGAMWDWAGPKATSRTALPLHWCDLTGILAGLVLLRPTRDTRAALHFWGICFSSIAFILPVETSGPAKIDFWVYFGSHAAILAAVVYDRFARGFLPTRRDYARIAIATAAWVVAVTPFNMMLDANYAYVGMSATHQRGIVSAFGEWPMRLVPLYLVSIGLMGLVSLTQHAVRRWRAVGALRLVESDVAIEAPLRAAA